MRKYFCQENGQALLVVVFFLAGALVLATSLVDTGTQVVKRLEFQNLADGSALQAGIFMADGLNAIALTNGVMLALGIGAFFSSGKTISFIRKIQRLQDEVIRTTPGLAISSSLLYKLGENSWFRYHLRKPKMQVRRVYFRFLWIKVPLWCKDVSPVDLRKTTIAIRHGERSWITTASSLPKGGRLIGKYIFWPLPSPTYRSYLVEGSKSG